MLDWGFGLGAFGMFFLYDWNRVFLKKRWFVPFCSRKPAAGCGGRKDGICLYLIRV